MNWIKEKLVEILLTALTIIMAWIDYFVITKFEYPSVWHFTVILLSMVIIAWWILYFSIPSANKVFKKIKETTGYERGYWDSSKYYYSLHYSYVHRYYKFINDLIQWLDENGLTTVKCKKEIKNKGFQRNCDVLLFTDFFTVKGNKFMEKCYNRLLNDVVEFKKPFREAIKSYKKIL